MVLSLAAFALFTAGAATAQVNEDFKLTASDAAAGDWFGWSVSVSGDTALVGASLDDDGGSSSGSAYVFVRDGSGVWTEQAKLTATDAAANDQFGSSVSVSGDTALVGVPFDDDGGSDSGSAYVFTRDGGGGWTQQAKLTASDAAGGDLFGFSVSISGDTALVGALLDDDGGSSSGSAYVFTRSGGVWTQQAKITASDAASNDNFGISVSVSGNTTLVGAWGNGNNSGSAYVFTSSGGVWTQQGKLTADDATAGNNFGVSVSLDGDTALIGSWRDWDAGPDSGSAYVFTRDGGGVWTQQAKLTASDAVGGELFGFSVSISGDTALVGARWDDDGGSDSGSAYVFTRSGGVWTQQDKFAASDAASGDEFGFSVSLFGDTALVGAFWDDDGGLASGSAYTFEFDYIPPTFSPITASPYWAYEGQYVTIIFTASEALQGNPVVTVNGNAASFSDVTGLNWEFSYTVQAGDPLGAALIEIQGVDLASNPGLSTSTSALAIVEEASVPVAAWPMLLALGAAGGILLRRRKQ